jgi:NADP-reducing hydrogenase subunit HndB
MKSLADLQKLREQAQKRVNMREVGNEEYRVVVGMGTCGIAAGARIV